MPGADAPPALALIAAVARNGVIGADNALPWKLPADLARFRALTTGHAIFMGRRTWESLGRPLPARQNIVVTRTTGYRADGALVVPSIDAALAVSTMPPPVFCIGGGALYRAVLPRADALYLTEIDRDYEGDTTFPPIDRREWRETERQAQAGVATDGVAYAFVTYRRRAQAARA
jgi:dihydrofolate reductase